MLVTVRGDCPLPAARKALYSALLGCEMFCFLSSFTPALSLSFFFKHNSPLSSHPVWQPFQNGKLQVSFPCQVLQPAMLSILLSYLKNVEYQQWLSLVHCQLLYEAILAEWDGSQSRESSAAVCTTTPVTARLFRSLYSSAALGAAVVVVLPSEWPRLRLWAVDVVAIFQSMVLLLLGRPADSQLLKVCLAEEMGKQQHPWDQSELWWVPSILWPEWEEVSRKKRREEGGGIQEDGAESFALCVYTICAHSTRVSSYLFWLDM